MNKINKKITDFLYLCHKYFLLHIDFLYYGDLEHGKVLSRDEIYQIVLANRESKSPIHIACLSYYPNTRKIDSRERNAIRIKWPMLSFLYYCDDAAIEKMKNGIF